MNARYNFINLTHATWSQLFQQSYSPCRGIHTLNGNLVLLQFSCSLDPWPWSRCEHSTQVLGCYPGLAANSRFLQIFPFLSQKPSVRLYHGAKPKITAESQSKITTRPSSTVSPFMATTIAPPPTIFKGVAAIIEGA